MYIMSEMENSRFMLYFTVLEAWIICILKTIRQIYDCPNTLARYLISLYYHLLFVFSYFILKTLSNYLVFHLSFSIFPCLHTVEHITQLICLFILEITNLLVT